MASFIPELASHVGIIFPRLVPGFIKDARHHLGHIDFTKPLKQKDQNLGGGRNLWVVQKFFWLKRVIERIFEPGITFRHWVINERDFGIHWTRDRRRTRFST